MSHEHELSEVEVKRHSLAHLLATVVLEKYPDAKLAIGPSIENGFYYDIDFGDVKIVESDLRDFEKQMARLAKQNLKFERSEKNIDEALAEAQKNNDTYKAELIADLKAKGETVVSFYTVGTFKDLCRGPHVENTGSIKPGSFKLD